MKIGIVIGTNQRGGAERQVSLLAQGLLSRGIDVMVFFLSRPTLFRKKISFGDVPCIHLWGSRFTNKMSLNYFTYLLKKHDISILHMFILGSIEFGLPAAHKICIKHTVGSVRSIQFSVDTTECSRLTKVTQAIQYVTCNCRAIKDLMINLNVCPPQKIKVINNGIIIDSQYPNRIMKQDNRDFNILFVGMIKDVKNPVHFIKAALLVLESNPQCRFMIAGDGPLRPSIEQLIANSKFSKHFMLLGNIAQGNIPYHQVDLLVSTSKREGSSNAILEALAHGIPVVATKVGGTVEILDGQLFGKLVRTDNIEETAHAINEFFQKGKLERETIAKKAQSFIRDNYSIDRMVDEHISFYSKILQEP